jgi:hypothetical protein
MLQGWREWVAHESFPNIGGADAAVLDVSASEAAVLNIS